MFQADIKKLLALIILAGFLGIILILFFVSIPQGNLDLLKTFGIALISIVSGIAGYYFGSSEGSARKTELLSSPANTPLATAATVPPVAETAQGGFVQIPLLLMILSLLLIAACATMKNDPPEVLAGKSLLAMKATIITAATAGDQLCKQHVIPATDCATLADYYHKAQPAYDLAADSLDAVLMSKDPAAWQRYQTDQGSFRKIFDDVVVLSGQYGLLGGAK